MKDYDVSRDDGNLDILTKSEIKTGMVPEVISGLADIQAEDFVGPVVGAGGTVVTTLLLRRMGYFGKLAPLVGIAGGMLLSLPLNWWKGSSVAAQGAVSSAVTGLAMWGYEQAEGMGLFGALVASPVGALVAQPVGALVASPVGYLPSVGESADIPGNAGPMDLAAFGTI